MIAIPSRVVRRNVPMRPLDCGCVFHYGATSKRIRVYLLTDNPLKAAACGAKLIEWGLPPADPEIFRPTTKFALAVNPMAPKKFEFLLGQVTHPLIKWSSRPIVLGTDSKEDLFRFSKWMAEHYAREQRQKEAEKAKKPPSLSDLAEAGEIKTYDCG